MARVFGSRCMVLAAIVIVVTLLCSVQVEARQACNANIQELIMHCSSFVRKNIPARRPSMMCCSAVKSVDIPCVCHSITKPIENMVDMRKVFRVAAYCGRPLRRGTKCGSTIV